jgi:hypothetical protein
MPEHDPTSQPPRNESAPPVGAALPPELADFLGRQPLACLLLGTDRGSSFVVKASADQIEGLRGPVPVLLRQELYRHPTSPVIRTLLRFYDRPHERPPSSLAFESFVNVDDEDQRSDYGELARQDEIDLHFYDDDLRHRLAKRVRNSLRPDVPLLLLTALRLRARIPYGHLDFDRAKAAVIARTSL